MIARKCGGDIGRVETEWPAVGMPLVRPPGGGLLRRVFKVRSNAIRIARTFFGVDDAKMASLHGMTKKLLKAPKQDFALAKKALGSLEEDKEVTSRCLRK